MSRTNRQLFEATSWEQTSLGAPERWPGSMLAVVRAVLASAFPISTAWGDSAVQIYNDAYNPIYGDKHPGSFGVPVVQSWPEIWSFLGPAIDDVRRSQTPLWFKSTLLPLARRGSPEECYFDFSYSPILDSTGEYLGLMSVAADKTVETVQLRRQAVDRFTVEAMADLTPRGIAQALGSLLAGNTMDVAKAAMFGVDQATGRPCELLWGVRCEGQADAFRRAAMTVPSHGTGRIDLPAPPGGEAASYAHGFLVRGTSGAAMAVVVIVAHRLVPAPSHEEFIRRLMVRVENLLQYAHKRAVEVGQLRDDLSERTTWYEFLFENIADAAFYASTGSTPDSEEFVLAVNARACEMLGYSNTELVGMSRDALFFSGDEKLRAALRARCSDGTFVGELVIRRKDGSELPVEISSRLVQLRNGELRSVSIVRDIARRAARARQEAERARFEGMRQLTGGFAHDFNNFLTVIVGNLDALAERLPPRSAEATLVASALLGAERAAALAGQLLTYSKRQSLKVERMDLAAFAGGIEKLLASSLTEAHRLEIDLPPGLVCELDPSQLTSALLNLIFNARDAMPAGGTVRIGARDVEVPPDRASADGFALAPGRYACLWVEDSGIGIPEEMLAKVFLPFFTSKDPGTGSGLGLTMVHGFMRQSGGDVFVHSEVDRGTRFELLLPLARPGQAAAA